MNWIDLLIALPIIIGTYKGYRKGILFQASSLLIWIFGLYVSKILSPITRTILQELNLVGQKYLFISSIALNFLLLVLGVYLVRKLLERFLKLIWMNKVNKIIGGMFGFVKVFVFVSAAVFLLDKANNGIGLGLEEKFEKSLFFQEIVDLNKNLLAMFFN